jgi:hypothetical protein
VRGAVVAAATPRRHVVSTPENGRVVTDQEVKGLAIVILFVAVVLAAGAFALVDWLRGRRR